MSSNEYMRVYMLRRYRARRARAVALLGGKCARCPSTKRLEFDHKDRTKKSFTICKLWSVSEERFLLELEKCQLLCRGCHGKKTTQERGHTPRSQHGSEAAYRHAHCRCGRCKRAHAARVRAYRREKRGAIL